MTTLVLLCATVTVSADASATKVLIVHDEPEPMEVLADAFEKKAGFTVVSVKQQKLPDDLSEFAAVFNFVHRPMTPRAEQLCIEYACNGGRHVLLHHAISSSKRQNPKLLAELKSEVPPGRKPANGFYVERGTLTFINLAPKHFITSNGITYPAKTNFSDAAGQPVEHESFSFDNTEIFLNLKFQPCPERTTLYGITFRDADGKSFAQHAGGWVMRTGKGYSFYFQAGHEARDFANPIYQQVLVNCVLWKPE